MRGLAIIWGSTNYKQSISSRKTVILTSTSTKYHILIMQCACVSWASRRISGTRGLYCPFPMCALEIQNKLSHA